MLLRKALFTHELAHSLSEATRLVVCGAVKVNGQVVNDLAFELPAGEVVISVGKKIVVKEDSNG